MDVVGEVQGGDDQLHQVAPVVVVTDAQEPKVRAGGRNRGIMYDSEVIHYVTYYVEQDSITVLKLAAVQAGN